VGQPVTQFMTAGIGEGTSRRKHTTRGEKRKYKVTRKLRELQGGTQKGGPKSTQGVVLQTTNSPTNFGRGKGKKKRWGKCIQHWAGMKQTLLKEKNRNMCLEQKGCFVWRENSPKNKIPWKGKTAKVPDPATTSPTLGKATKGGAERKDDARRKEIKSPPTTKGAVI